MRRNIFLILILTIIILIFPQFSIKPIFSQPPSGVQAYLHTDKPYYRPGESGTLSIQVRNDWTHVITIKKIEVTFPWFGWYNDQWDGNATISDLNETVAINNASKTYTVSFKVPTERRTQVYSSINVKVSYEYEVGSKGTEYNSLNVPMEETPVSESPIHLALFYIGIVLLAIIAVCQFLLLSQVRKLRKITSIETAVTKMPAPITSETQPQVFTQPPTLQEKKLCIYCGAEIPQNAIHCPKCGKKQ